jgi:hypothetical protein
MWIKAEDGTLHNLDHIHTLEVNIEPGGYYIVKARFAQASGATAELTRHGARAQAKRTLDAIGEAMQNQGHREGFLDLNQLHAPKGPHANALPNAEAGSRNAEN